MDRPPDVKESFKGAPPSADDDPAGSADDALNGGSNGGTTPSAGAISLTELLKRVRGIRNGDEAGDDAAAAVRARRQEMLDAGDDVEFSQGGVPRASRASWPVSFMLRIATVCMECDPDPSIIPQRAVRAAAARTAGTAGTTSIISGRVRRPSQQAHEQVIMGGAEETTLGSSAPPLHIPQVETALDSTLDPEWTVARHSLTMMLWSSVRCAVYDVLRVVKVTKMGKFFVDEKYSAQGTSLNTNLEISLNAE